MSVDYIFSRKHELLTRNDAVWRRTRDAYSGGQKYIEQALIKHVSELEDDFLERKARAIYINHVRHIAQLISRFIYSIEPDREGGDTDLIEDWNRGGLRTNEVMLQASTMLTCYGVAWLLVDYPSVAGKIDMSTKVKQNIRPFVRTLTPFAVVDYDIQNGKIVWAIVEETFTDKSNPFEKPVCVTQRRLWTANEWILYEKRDYQITEIARGVHNLGVVPLVKLEEPDGFGMKANHWFEDVVRVSDAIMNAESEAQMNIIKQMFGLLIVPQAMGQSEGVKATRSNALWEANEEKGITRYISPSGTEVAAIRNEIGELKRNLYEVVGLALQSSSKTQQTAESKAWDNHNVEQFLATRSGILEQAEQRAWDLMNLWDSSVNAPQIAYNREFSVADLSTSVAALMDLSSFDAGNEYTKATNLNALALLDKVARISPALYQAIEKEINSKDYSESIPRVDVEDINKKEIKEDDMDAN